MATIEYGELIREGGASSEEMVSVERTDGYAVLTMRDPDKLNVLSAADGAAPPHRRGARRRPGGARDRGHRRRQGFSTGGDLRRGRSPDASATSAPFEFYVGGEHVTAEQAAELGLVNHVVAGEELLPTAREWGERIAALPPHAVRMAKPLLPRGRRHALRARPADGGARRADLFHDGGVRGNVEALLESR